MSFLIVFIECLYLSEFYLINEYFSLNSFTTAPGTDRVCQSRPQIPHPGVTRCGPRGPTIKKYSGIKSVCGRETRYSA
jgi:hypothetical protein